MQVRVHYVLLSVFLVLGVSVQGSCTSRKALRGFGSLVQDALLINKKLFSWSSYKILTITFPAYFAASLADKPMHSYFYDRDHHKNRCQFGAFFHGFAQYGIAFPVFFAGAAAVSARNDDLLYTSRIYLIGLPFVMAAGDLIKACMPETECSFRPWHEHFSRTCRSHGGFPSGHMALATYTAALYGMRFGPPYVIAFGSYAVLVAAGFVNCNRHYASQIVAGAGLGLLYAFAANKVIDEKLACLRAKNIDIGFDSTSAGKPAINISYRF